MSFRKRVNKYSSSRKFRRNSSRTKGANMIMPNRGGYRL